MSGDGKGRGPVRRPRVIERPRVAPGPLADLKALIYELYLQAGTPTLNEITAAVVDDDEMAGAPGRDTISRVIGDPGLPTSQADVVAVVAALARAARWDPGDAARRARDLWVAAWMASARYPAGGIRVSQADPRRLGVHAAISVPGVPDEIPPEYVLRDADDGELGVQAKVAAATERGGFVLLVGGSSVGKTRSAFEAVSALVPDWWLVHPANPAEVAALAAAPTPRTVVWLDELQRYLSGEHGLTGGMIRALLGPPRPSVIIGTLWPELYSAYTTPPAPGVADPHAREREVVELAEVVRIGPAFSPAEQGRARAAAGRDPRLQIALHTAGYGLTQTLAAAPQLVARWEDAQTANPYGWAVLAAALDAARLGARAPLTADFLRAAAPGYCTSRQQAEAPEDWFEQALAYATEKLHGAAAALAPDAAGMGRVAGYTAADYLIQHASPERRYARVPASTWDAILSHLSDPDDASWLADSARNRLLYCYAIPLYRLATVADDEKAAKKLVDLLAGRGDLDGAEQILRNRAGDEEAALLLARLLAGRGDLDGLRARADAGDRAAALQLARLLEDRDNPEEAEQVLRDWADDQEAAERLAGLLTVRGDLDGAEQILRARASNGDKYAAVLLDDLLLEWRGDLDRAEQILRARASDGDWNAEWRLANLLARRGNPEEAKRILRDRTHDALLRVALLVGGGGHPDLAEQRLRDRADVGDGAAAIQLAGLLAWRGDLDRLRARADAGDGAAAIQLARLLADRDPEEAEQRLRDRADAFLLLYALLLAGTDDPEEAEQILRDRADVGDVEAAVELARLLAWRGDLDGLRARADVGDGAAAFRLARLLTDRGDLDGAEQILRDRDVGEAGAAMDLADLLAKRGDLDGAEQILRDRADVGDGDATYAAYAIVELAGLLARRGNLDAILRDQVDVALHGRADVTLLLPALLRARHGDLDGAEQILRDRADAGDEYAELLLADLLAVRGDLEEAEQILRARVDAGDEAAAARLPDLLAKQGRGEEAERMRRFGLYPDGSIAWA